MNRSFFRLVKSAFRNKWLTLISIFGLGVGLAVVMFLLVYLQFEFSFDKHFKDAERIYRMLSTLEEENETARYPLCLRDLAPQLLKEVPEVEMAARLYRGGSINVSWEGGKKLDVSTYVVDPEFLRIFDFTPVAGSPETALDVPGHCVITRQTAERIFGGKTDPIGKVLAEGESLYEVAAVIENVPENSHFQFDMLIRLSGMELYSLEFFTYLKFREGVDISAAIKKCNETNIKLLTAYYQDYFSGGFGSETECLTVLHTATHADFDLSPVANKTNLIFIALVAILVLIIAVSNFLSLYMIQGEERALEIGVYKTNGALRSNIVIKLLSEILFITLLAFLFALGLYACGADSFAHVLNFNLPKETGMNGYLGIQFFVLFLCIVCIIGIYPAFYLSRFQPMELLRKSNVRKFRLTALSVVFQFSIVLFCVIALLVIGRQMDYIRKLPLGFQPENVLEVYLGTKAAEYEGLRSELLECPDILQVAVGQANLFNGGAGQVIRRSDQLTREAISVNEYRIGPEYLDVYSIPIVKGRNFSKFFEGEGQYVILSESLVKALGMKDPIDKKVFIDDKPHIVIGVAKDVVQSAHTKPEKRVYTAYANNFFLMAVKFAPGKYEEARQAVQLLLKKRYKGIPVGMVLTTDIVDFLYHQDKITQRIMVSGTILAVILTVLGLLALNSFIVLQKRKEIGVRRVMGAEVRDIVCTLGNYILLRILPAIPLGIILGYVVMQRWLENFEYARTLEVWIFLMAVAATLVFAILTIFYQLVQAACSNPVDSLRSE